MHVSKTSNYFSISAPPENHISTSGMYLAKYYKSTSIFCYPMSGSVLKEIRFNHDNKGSR